MIQPPDTIFIRGRITTMARHRPDAQALAVRGGLICAVGDDREVAALAQASTRCIDLGGRRVVPGLVESHKRPADAAAAYCVELRWDGLPTAFDAIATLREQVRRDPPPRLIRVVGGFRGSEVIERRLPTLEEINEVAPRTPVSIMHLFDECLFNAAATRALGFGAGSVDPAGARLIRCADAVAGLASSRPVAVILSASLASIANAPAKSGRARTAYERSLLRLGVTSLDHAGAPPATLARVTRRSRGATSPPPGRRRTAPGLPGPAVEAPTPAPFAFSLSDFEDFRHAGRRSALQEEDLFEFIRALSVEKVRFRLHVADGIAAGHALEVLERVDTEVPLRGLAWELDCADGPPPGDLARIVRLGGHPVSQRRQGWRGEPFIERFGLPSVDASSCERPTAHAVVQALRMASCNPWRELTWLATGRLHSSSTTRIRPGLVDRTTALWLYTDVPARAYGDLPARGRLEVGLHADFAVLSRDYLRIPDADIPSIRSVLTVLGGRPVHAEGEFRGLLRRKVAGCAP